MQTLIQLHRDGKFQETIDRLANGPASVSELLEFRETLIEELDKSHYNTDSATSNAPTQQRQVAD